MIFVEIVGWTGMVLLLFTFFLASNQWLCDKGYPYHLLNLIGALGVMINAFYKGVWAVVSLETIWAMIAIVGIGNVFRHQRRAT